MDNNEFYDLTGSEDEQLFHYRTKMKDLDIYFVKTIKIYNGDQSNFDDIYEETFRFPTYHFTIGKKIPKINMVNLPKQFVKEYQCDISNNYYGYIYNKVWQSVCNNQDNKKQINVVPPDNSFEKYSKQLYDKYVKYYNQIIEITKRARQIESIKIDNYNVDYNIIHNNERI